MSQPEVSTAKKAEVDSEILAIRSLLKSEDTRTAVAPAPRQHEGTQDRIQRRSNAPRKRDDLPPLEQPARQRDDGQTAEPRTSALAGLGHRIAQLATGLAHAAIDKAKAYDPDRKTILRTSFILLLILRPFLLIGWALFGAFTVILSYLFMGPDRFWRQIIALHRAFARRRPDAARVLKLRAYVIARKWDSLLRWVPQGLADMLRSPDLRELIAADARHDEAMAKRLGRLGDDLAV